MKKQGVGGAASTRPGVHVDHERQSAAFRMFPENGRPLKNGSCSGTERLVGPDAPDCGRDPKRGMKDEPARRGGAPWRTDSGGQAYSGPEDNSTDPQETLTETSTLTFVDAHTTEESADNHSLAGVETIYLKEFVLIDDDDDGDMSLREKTVTDFSVADGKAADLVCGRLLSTSSCSLSECKEESVAPGAPPPGEEQEEEEEELARLEKRCCFCTIF